ncbi:hypothetical protein CALVIDRAFT_205118 [Calocera viscosa TUFC12733]|uniref:Uncharacterized protein n=1 Tax=Calocera viscosa (strain TUFC12733) TaxID=1330018 RepID=A0A167KD28_CALVF|nr:hypothetical protein CALVIDRAFT_205118 [Calocera viscosa TUFC12733]
MHMQTRSKRSTTRVEQVERSSLAERSQRVERVEGSSRANSPRNLSTSPVEPLEGPSRVKHTPNLSPSRTEVVQGSSFFMPCASINTLPVEIVRYIIRLATDVPVAFDTSSESVLDEDRVETRRLILESIKTKSSLSIVSKLFHILVDEYLYEILFLTKFPGYTSLRLFAAFLRKKRRGDVRSRGDRVRRLELDFSFHAYDWTTSWDSLWGLIPACPKLETLTLLFQPEVEPSRQWRITAGCSEQFARNIGRIYGGTLRKLEIGGDIIFPQHCIQPMLACMENLEVIYIRDVGHHAPNPSVSNQWTGTLSIGNRMKHLHTILGQTLRLDISFHSSPRLRHVSLGAFVPPTVHDLLRLHAGSIVSLYYEQNLFYNPVPGILETLPNLEHLLLRDCRDAAWDILPPTQARSNLRILTRFLTFSSHEETGLLRDMESLLQRVEEGRLPQFKKIRLGGLFPDEYRQRSCELGEAWSRLGITWEERPDLTAWHIILTLKLNVFQGAENVVLEAMHLGRVDCSL